MQPSANTSWSRPLDAMRALSKFKLCCVFLAVLVVIVIWGMTLRVKTVQGLSRKDVIHITHTVRKQVWQEFFPISSLSRQMHLPLRVCEASKAEIQIDGPQPDGTVQAEILYPHRAVLYSLSKQSNRWGIAGRPLVLGRP